MNLRAKTEANEEAGAERRGGNEERDARLGEYGSKDHETNKKRTHPGHYLKHEQNAR
jgi:hypothetical protein